MYVITRDGTKTPIRYDKITDRNVEFASDLNVDVAKLSKAVIAGLKDGMHTSEIDKLSAETAFYMSTYEPEFDKLAVRIAVSNLHKSTNASFSETVKLLKEFINPKTGQTLNIISEPFYNFVQKNKDILDSSIVGTRDFKFSYFGFKTLCRSYLLKCDNKIVERPQYMWMRVAASIHMPLSSDFSEDENEEAVKKTLQTYDLMSQFYFTHATPTLFNAGSNHPQMSSCFLLTMDDDLRHIYTTNFRSAIISKHAGGIGIDITRVRAKGSTIHSTNGKSNGIVPMIKVFNSTALYCDQAGKRKGSIAMYLEPWHADVLDFLQLRFNLPPEDIRARDIFIAMWINDLFMKRVEKDEMWSLFCPNTVPLLANTYGDEFESIYLQAEAEGKYVKQIKAQEVWKAILNSQMETGLPYICYKDSVNKKSNQKNIGIVRSSNLCVSGDTKILTSRGNLVIKDLVNKKIEVWNGKEWSATEVKQTSTSSKLLKITTSNNRELKCTEYHKFPVQLDSTLNKTEYVFIEAQNLKVGYKIVDCHLPGFSYNENIFVNTNIPSYLEDSYYFELKDVFISKIETLEEFEPTYCFNEPIRHMGLFNGILTGNCTEIMEVTENDSISVCLTEDTRILTKNGLKKIIDCNNEEILVPFKSDKELIQQKNVYKKALLIDNGKRDVYQINLKGVSPIKATENHKFLTVTKTLNPKPTDYIWKTVKELKPLEDKIVISTNEECDNCITVKKEYHDLDYACAGWCLGDGWFVTNKRKCDMGTFGVCFGPTEEYAKNTVCNFLNNIHINTEVKKYGHEKDIKIYKDRNGVYNWATSKVNTINYLCNKFGFSHGKGIKKFLPEKIFNENSQNIASYLSGLFSADGCVAKMTNKPPVIMYSSASYELLKDLYNILKIFGIHGRISWTNNITNREGKSQGNLNINGYKNFCLFNEKIGFSLCPEKQIKLEKSIEEMKDKSSKIPLKKSRDWAIISSIEFIGTENVYDLSLADSHNFIANGLVTHNCNLSSISLPGFVDIHSRKFDFVKLGEVVEIITENLNKVIDKNYYPLEEAKSNNLAYRPIGIGIQGLADTFAMLDYCWGDEGSKQINRLISEVIYYHALKRSCELSKKDGPYSRFEGSPSSQGILQYHMWNTLPLTSQPDSEIQLNWEELIQSIKQYGLRNSLLIAPMPTASTAQILNNNESFEMFTTNIFSRSTLAGDFTIVNKHLYSDLNKLGLWTPQLVDQILAADGSIQHLNQIPQHIRNKYKTVWELSQKIAIDYAADRAPFIDQSQSLNIYIDYATHAKLTSMHFYGWKKGLKTGSYYIHSKPARSAVKFTVSNDTLKSVNGLSSSIPSTSTNSNQVQKKKFVCVGEEGCLSCGS